jgi:hypothetical protein
MEKINPLTEDSLYSFDENKDSLNPNLSDGIIDKISFHKSKQKFYRWTEEEVSC